MPLIDDLIALHRQVFKLAIPPDIYQPISLAADSISTTITTSISAMSGRLQEGQDKEKALRGHIAARSKESGKNALDYLLSGQLFWVPNSECGYCFPEQTYRNFLQSQKYGTPLIFDTVKGHSGTVDKLEPTIEKLAFDHLPELINAIKAILGHFDTQKTDEKEDADTNAEPKSNQALVQLFMGNPRKNIAPLLHALFTSPLEAFRLNILALAQPIFDHIKKLSEHDKRTIAKAVNEKGETIFHIVARDGNAEQLQSLYNAFGDKIFRELLQVKNGKDEISYHLALQSGYKRIEKIKKIHQLLQKNFSELALFPMEYGQNSLHLMFIGGAVPNIELLGPICATLESSESKEGEKTLKEEAVLAIHKYTKENAVYLACRAGNSECFDRLLQDVSEQYQKDALKAGSVSALIYALDGGNTDIVSKVIAIIGPQEAYRVFTKKDNGLLVLERIYQRFQRDIRKQVGLTNVVIQTIGIVAVYDLINARSNAQKVAKISPQVSAGLLKLFSKSVDENLLAVYHYLDKNYSSNNSNYQNRLAHFKNLLIVLLSGGTTLENFTRKEARYSTNNYADFSDAIIASPPDQEKIRTFIKFLEKESVDHPAATALWDGVKAYYKPASKSEDSESKNAAEEDGLLTVPQQPSPVSGGLSGPSAPVPSKPSVEVKSEIQSFLDEIQRLKEQLLDENIESFQMSRKLAQLYVKFSEQLRVQDEEAMPQEYEAMPIGHQYSDTNMGSDSVSLANSTPSASSASSNSSSTSSTKSSRLLGQFGSSAIHTSRSNTFEEPEPGVEPEEGAALTGIGEGQIETPAPG